MPNTPPTLIPFFTIQLEPYGLVIAKHFHRHEVAKAHSPGQSEAAPRVSNATSNPQPCNPLIRWALLFRFDRFCSSSIEIFSPRHISSYSFIVPCDTWAQTCIGNRKMAVNVGMVCCINKYFAKNKRHFTKKKHIYVRWYSKKYPNFASPITLYAEAAICWHAFPSVMRQNI